ncbi:cupin domain-containing protein [Pseudoalteromonas sp. OOF1S-7]|uniref:1,2-dihydroxy-3-keto-5-methylthiopentene dioxygenase n=1 Tax=Pseudoalteromonas sp. OOF1S-7 TaxID=2917757 RepID=UPI001EF462AA|nr:cupin domain-containing protein [Pseudoalteromonas sp. OOF1S-7]MCG7536031.1 cupin domain-containing protein [Pseudoalteromonas sp. OOF1S-7]
MSQLTIFHDKHPDSIEFQSTVHNQIASQLAQVGVRFEQWEAAFAITKTTSHEDILDAYQRDITRLKAQGGYLTVDVISLSKGHPDAASMRQKFLFEHTHSEDEVRFFVEGQGLFCLHIGEQVYQVLCQQGDLISVPAMTPHWFDMGSDPQFTAIRLFNNAQGWVAQSTDNPIAERFPLLG